MIIREARPCDIMQIAKVHVDSWNTTYRGIIPDDYLNNRTYHGQAKKWNSRLFNCQNIKEFMYVAETENGEVVGFASGSTESEIDAFESILYTLYILKDYQRKGIGLLLVKAVVDHLNSFNIKSMMLWVLGGNSACGFYEYLGGTLVGEKKVSFKGKELNELAYGWNDIENILGICK